MHAYTCMHAKGGFVADERSESVEEIEGIERPSGRRNMYIYQIPRGEVSAHPYACICTEDLSETSGASQSKIEPLKRIRHLKNMVKNR